MATLVCFHAHPDDEAIATGGTMLLASRAGHRVVLVMATKGEQGEPVEGVLDLGETLGERRVTEVIEAADILGIHRVEFLGYEDSGMIDEPSNDNPDCFWRADVHEAATRLAAILQEEDADVFTIYDPHGGYGHPDHIQVHRVGLRAALRAGVDLVYEATVNRDHVAELAEVTAELDLEEDPFAEDHDTGSETDLGVPGWRITHRIDVASVIDRKRKAMALHASQINEDSFFMKLSDDAFTRAFGVEWFIRSGVEPDGSTSTDLFEPLES